MSEISLSLSAAVCTSRCWPIHRKAPWSLLDIRLSRTDQNTSRKSSAKPLGREMLFESQTSLIETCHTMFPTFQSYAEKQVSGWNIDPLLLFRFPVVIPVYFTSQALTYIINSYMYPLIRLQQKCYRTPRCDVCFTFACSSGTSKSSQVIWAKFYALTLSRSGQEYLRADWIMTIIVEAFLRCLVYLVTSMVLATFVKAVINY